MSIAERLTKMEEKLKYIDKVLTRFEEREQPSASYATTSIPAPSALPDTQQALDSLMYLKYKNIENGNPDLPLFRYYHIRDYMRKPMVTVCLIKWRNVITRGVSFCSEKDNPCKATGRKIAKDRALAAFEKFGHDLPVSIGRKAWAGFTHKSYCNPILTSYEKRILREKD